MKFAVFKYIAFIIPFVCVFLYCKNHYTTSYIINGATKDINENRNSIEKLTAYFDSITDEKYSQARILFRHGWNNINIDLFTGDSTLNSKSYQEVAPTFVYPLLFNSNGLTAYYKKGRCVIFDYPYSTYSLQRVKLIFCYNKESVLDEYKEMKYPVYYRISDAKSKKYIYVLNESWLVNFEDN